MAPAAQNAQAMERANNGIRWRRIGLRLWGRERQSGEPDGERCRVRYWADAHELSRFGPDAPRPAHVVRPARQKKLTRSCGSGPGPRKSAAVGVVGSLHGHVDFGRAL